VNIPEMQRTLRSLRLGRMSEVVETRIIEAQSARLSHADFLSMLIGDELQKRADRLLSRRIRAAEFRDAGKTLDTFDFDFNKKMNRREIFELATCGFLAKHEDILLLGPPGTGKSHLCQAIGHAAITHGHRVVYREAHTLIEQLADAALDGTRREVINKLATADLLIIDDLGMRKLPQNAAEELLELCMRRYERGSTIITSNRPVEDWSKLLGDTAAVTAMLDRMLHHGHVIKCGPRPFRTRQHTSSLPQEQMNG
jgi:DNA replication protein DnaC